MMSLEGCWRGWVFEEFCYEEQLNRKKDLYGMTDGKKKRNINRRRRVPCGMITEE